MEVFKRASRAMNLFMTTRANFLSTVSLTTMSPRTMSLIALTALLLLPASANPQSSNTKNGTATQSSRLKEFTTKYLTSTPVILSKAEVVVSPKTLDYLESQKATKGSANFWVFFADKGLSAAATLKSNPKDFPVLRKSLTRRAKMGMDKIVFADLPVEINYINSIESLGASKIRASRWLNGATFSVNTSSANSQNNLAQLLNQIASLPFVIEIKPALTFVRIPAPSTVGAAPKGSNPPSGSSLFGAEAALNYGTSLQQITQIKADIGHQRGYKGQGVTIAMLDTGYRKSHQAFATAFSEGRVIAEYDFINNDNNTANELGDVGSQWSHGTLTWSTAGGQFDGKLYGPAYGANFLLAKTENVPFETIQEEFDWVAAMEWADSLGADVISSSLGYIDWYTFSDLDGATAVTTIGANMAAGLGIVVCDAMGNSGSGSGSLIAPADAFNILSVGAVDVTGTVASFSSRGPTADGRIKPEVCARGVSTWSASSGTDVAYTTSSGTSLSTPLVAGAVAQLISAKPTFPPLLIIENFKSTASNPLSPDNNIGWGIINVEAALDWGVNFTANGSATNLILEDFPVSVSFADNSDIAASDWTWDFGDSQGATGVSSPAHNYTALGLYDVSLTIQTTYGAVSKVSSGFVLITADTLEFVSDSGYAGNSFAISVNLTNTQPLQSIEVPFSYADPLIASYDSATVGSRTATFLTPTETSIDPINKKIALRLTTAGAPVAAGAGEIMKLYFTLDPLALGGESGAVDSSTIGGAPLLLTSPVAVYPTKFTPATVSTKFVLRGDADNGGSLNIADVVFLIFRIFKDGSAPITIQSGDANADQQIRIDDATYLIAYIFSGGPPPPTP